MKTLSERLQFALGRNPDLSQAGLAKACDVRPPSVTDWLSGRTKKMEGANLLMAAQFLDVNPWWLATGKGPVARSGADVGSAGAEQRPLEAPELKRLSTLLTELIELVMSSDEEGQSRVLEAARIARKISPRGNGRVVNNKRERG